MFRIWIYLSFKNFLKSIFLKKTLSKVRFIEKYLEGQSKKKYSHLFSQCRIAFYFILCFLKKNTKKNEIIFCAYNLPEMINIAKNLGLKIKFYDLNYETGSAKIQDIKKKISKKTLAVVLTNMFNNYSEAKKIKDILKRKKITLIEDNAIYFDNFSLRNGKKYYSGSVGDFSVYSFNIMKNISSFYGGAASSNNKKFKRFCEQQEKKLNNFFLLILIKQILIFFVLKIMSIKSFYKYFFKYFIFLSHKFNINFLLKLYYPSMKNINLKFPKYYFSKISPLSINATYLQLKDKKRRNEIFNYRKQIHKYYFKKLSNLSKTKIKIIKKNDPNYQNYLDFPVLVKEKDKLNLYLLKNGIEARLKHYYNCGKIFKDNILYKNAERYEKELICFPAHIKTKNSYIDNIEVKLNKYY